MTTLTISPIGDPRSTVVTEHVDADAAREALVDRYGEDVYFRDEFNGTVGHRGGRVFQASSTWRIVTVIR